MREDHPITSAPEKQRLSSGVPGLDALLCGGLIPGNAYAVKGGPGTGKTILGLHFVSCPRPGGNRLLVTMGEDADRIRANADTLGISLDDVEILDLSPRNCAHALAFRLVSPTETDFHRVMTELIETVRRLSPVRIFVDFARTLRLLTPDPYTYRIALISILGLFCDAGATTLVAAEQVPLETEDLAYMVDGVVELGARPVMATTDRTIRVIKTRGSDFIGGQHSMRIDADGLRVIPRILTHWTRPVSGDHIQHSTGIPDLDTLLGGGIEQGTITLLTGSAGTGKSTLGLQMLLASSLRGERSLVYTFDEEPAIMRCRLKMMDLDLDPVIEKGHLSIIKIEPAVLSADEFEDMLRHEVEEGGARQVMIDSTAGFQLAIRDDRIVSRMHAVCKYLQTKGVSGILTTEISTLGGVPSITDQRFSYLVDNVILMRHWDAPTPEGHVTLRTLLLVLKKRLSTFDRSVHEVGFGPGGIRILGPAEGLTAFFGSRIGR